MLELIELFFREYMPHGICLQWNPLLIGTMSVGDMGTGLAYMVFTFIALQLLVSTPKRGQPEHQILKWLVAFIFFCGIGHFIKNANIWLNEYQLEALWGVTTAVISWRCVFLLFASKSTIQKKYTSLEKTKALEQENMLLKIEIKGLKDSLDLR